MVEGERVDGIRRTAEKIEEWGVKESGWEKERGRENSGRWGRCDK